MNAIPLNSIKKVHTRHKINEIVKDFLFAGDTFMPEIHLRQPGFTYGACGPFTKRIQIFEETGDSLYLYQNKLDKACFQHDVAYGDFKDDHADDDHYDDDELFLWYG